MTWLDLVLTFLSCLKKLRLVVVLKYDLLLVLHARHTLIKLFAAGCKFRLGIQQLDDFKTKF